MNYLGEMDSKLGMAFWLVFRRSSTEAIRIRSPMSLSGIDQMVVTIMTSNQGILDTPV